MKAKLLFTALSLFAVIGLSAQDAKYEIKSAIIKKSVEMFGQKTESTTFFDDYGKLEARLSDWVWEGSTTHMRTITTDENMTMINLDNKTAFIIKHENKPVNFLKLTKEITDKHKIKELGTENIAGKPCKKYSMEATQMGQTVSATVWIWKGITLKTTSSFNDMTMTETATEITENATVDPALFKVPQDVKIQDSPW